MKKIVKGKENKRKERRRRRKKYWHKTKIFEECGGTIIHKLIGALRKIHIKGMQKRPS